MKKRICSSAIFASLVLTLVVIMALTSCTTQEIEQTVDPETGRITVPFSIKATTATTKVTLGEKDGKTNNYTYILQEGDELLLTWQDHADFEGDLVYHTDKQEFSGSLTYNEGGAPQNSDVLTATLCHPDNAQKSGQNVNLAADLATAVNEYSDFTGTFHLNDKNVHLSQNTAFVVFDVEFEANSRLNVSGTKTTVTNGSAVIASGDVAIKDGKAHFAIAVAQKDAQLDKPYVTMGGKKIAFAESTQTTALSANHYYSVDKKVCVSLGDAYCSDGSWGQFGQKADIIGIVAYVNDGSETGNAVTEAGSGYGHALVMALNNAATAVKWGETQQMYSSSSVSAPSDALTTDISGYALTNAMLTKVAANEQQNKVTAAYYAKNYGETPKGSTGWFLPSVGQWLYTVGENGLASTLPVSSWVNTDGTPFSTATFKSLFMVKQGDDVVTKAINSAMAALSDHYESFGYNSDQYGLADNYWTSSEKDKSNAIRLCFGANGTIKKDKTKTLYSGIKITNEVKSHVSAWQSEFKMKVRPFLAF